VITCKRHIGDDTLAVERVRLTANGGITYTGMGEQYFLDLTWGYFFTATIDYLA
jgi:hypothetical protein